MGKRGGGGKKGGMGRATDPTADFDASLSLSPPPPSHLERRGNRVLEDFFKKNSNKLIHPRSFICNLFQPNHHRCSNGKLFYRS